MTTLLFVRHGPTDINLSAAGRELTAAFAPVIERWQPRTAIVSPLARTRSTAALLSGLTPVVDDRWVEAGLGEWEGRRPAEIGADYARWRSGELTPPGGEAASAVADRVGAAVRAAAEQPGPVLILTHGGTIRAVLAQFVGLTAAKLEPVAAPSLTVLDVAAGSARLRTYNVTC
jgi:broad specificity phosphatase PhoE